MLLVKVAAPGSLGCLELVGIFTAVRDLAAVLGMGSGSKCGKGSSALVGWKAVRSYASLQTALSL